MMPAVFPSAEIVVGIAVTWMLLGMLSLLEGEGRRFVARFVFPASAALCVVLAIVAARALPDPAQTMVLPLGLPELPFHVRVDPLAAFFLFLLGVGTFAVGTYSCGYFRDESPARLRLLSLQYHFFLASMAFVIVADDAYSFMVAWETMALSSYFLVTTDHHKDAIRSAGFLYVLIAHVGAIALLLCFGVLQGGGGFDDYRFDAMRGSGLTPFWQSVAFLLALLGFGAKAGVVPLHAWLPEAHPAAPSPVSALMSGVMLKTAIYGLVRVGFDLIGGVYWQWGLAVAILGAATALFGILYALQQNDLKRLLAYSSIENIGIVLIGIGLAMVFFGTGHVSAGALALIAALYHALNHCVCKSLLFLGAGSVLHSTGLRSLNEMGGLIRTMPRTAVYFLVGVLAISALAPLNGFASEWLTFQAALQAAALEDGVLRSILPLLAAMLALTGALTAMCFVKAYGTAFLGVPRERRETPEHHAGGDAGLPERIGMAWLAAFCLLLGIFPSFVVALLNDVVRSLTGGSLPEESLAAGWLWLVPADAAQASYGPLVFLITIVAVVLITFAVSRFRFRGRVRRADPWDCGFPEQTARMQDSAEAFGQPVRWIFAPVYRIRRRVPAPDDPRPRYELEVEDVHWRWFYVPVARLVEFLSARLGVLQQGRISVYLMYSFVTLLALLVFVR